MHLKKKSSFIINLLRTISITLIFVFVTCKKIDINRKTLIVTQAVENLTQTSAFAKGHIVDLSEVKEHSDYGFCWDTLTGNLHFKTSLGTAQITGDYSKNINGLRGGKKYCLRAYIKEGNDYVYGEIVSFVTPNPLMPVITTNAVTNIKDSLALGGGRITFDGGADIRSRGVCWSTSQNPTIADSYNINGADTGVFSCKINKLSLHSIYYVRAFATNKVGTSYGNQVSFNPDNVQQRLIKGETPKQIYDGGIVLDSLFGKIYQGGLIAYLNTTTGTGLIAAPTDQGRVQWYNGSNNLTNATGTAIGTGQSNTSTIVTVQGAGSY